MDFKAGGFHVDSDIVVCFEKLTAEMSTGGISTNIDVCSSVTDRHSITEVTQYLAQSISPVKIKTFTNVLKRCELEWLVAHCRTSDDTEDRYVKLLKMFENLVKSLCEFVLNTLQLKQEQPLAEDDFPNTSENSHLVINCLLALASRLQDSKTDILTQIFKSQMYIMLEIIAVNSDESLLWASHPSCTAAQKFLNLLLEGKGSASIENLLTRTDFEQPNQKHTVLQRVLNHIRDRLTKQTWKLNPGCVTIFTWCLFHMRSPNIGDYVDQLLPPALMLSDDFVLENKLSGVRCLDHIIRNASATELSWFGRSEVIYEALHRHLYTHEVDMIAILHLCLLSLMAAIHRSRLKTNDYSWDKCDDVFQTVLFEMEMENKIALRRAYAEQIEHYVHALGLGVVRHFNCFV